MNGYREKERHLIKLGTTIILDKKYLKTGYLNKEHVKEILKRIVKVEDNPYIRSKEKGFWYLYTVASYEKSIKAITENNGIITTELIENLFDDTELIYTVVNNSITYRDCYKGTDGECITAREAVKRYGLRVMDEVGERTVSNKIDKEFLANKRNNKLKKI